MTSKHNGSGPKQPALTNEAIRERILRFLYERHSKPKGVEGNKAKVLEIRKAMKVYGISAQQSVSNLNFLVDTGWVIKEVERYPIRRGNRTVHAKEVTYRISDKGVNYFEGTSKFQTVERYGIRIDTLMNIAGITQVGTNNFARVEFAELSRSLGLLATEIWKTDQLTSEEKLNYQSEILTIQDQLLKPKPDKNIVSRAWIAIEKAATISTLANTIVKVAPLIQSLLGG